ncbi:MAG: AsmA family protein [Hyphomicrobiales bacterium]|nr:AsmA family protein [Hyphomicrobiales bacterium]
MKRLLALPAILLVLAAFAIFALPYLVPGSYLKSQIAPLLEKRTGIELRNIDEIALTFTPEFGVAATNVVAALKRGDRRGRQLQSERVVATPDLGALLTGRIVIRKIRLEDPILTVQNGLISLTDAGHQTGVPYLTRIAYAQAQTEPASRPINFPPIDVDIVNGRVNILNRSGKQVVSLAEATFALRHPAVGETVTLEGNFNLEGEPFRLTAKASASKVAKALYKIDASLHSPATGTEFEGNLHLEDRPNFEGVMRGGIVSGKDLARWMGGDAGAFNRLTGALFEGQLKADGRAFQLSEGKLSAPSVKSDLSVTSEFGKRLEVVLANGEIYGGTSDARFELVRGEANARMSASLKLNNVDSEAFSRDLPGFDWLSGPVNSDLQLSGQGRSWQAILGSLAGTSAFSVSNGAIEGIDLSLIVAEAKEGRFDAWERRPGFRTRFDIMEASFDINDGVGRTEDMRVVGPGVNVTGKGNVNFSRQRIDYKLQTRISSKADESQAAADKQAKFSLPLIVKGRWDNPSIYPDVTQMFRDPESISGTGELIGKSLEQLSRGEGDGNALKGVLNDLFGNNDEADDDSEESD